MTELPTMCLINLTAELRGGPRSSKLALARDDPEGLFSAKGWPCPGSDLAGATSGVELDVDMLPLRGRPETLLVLMRALV
mmetsp:Transcript_149193/g.479170  ORF Transcript_149193/g.479170 Transcript_149193/m.479170 type:complete len:80 (-) Transcript_149193:913-1152(-)